MRDLLAQGERVKALFTWPEAVNERLDVLVRAAADAGESSNRSLVLAALVSSAAVDPDELAGLLRDYRRLDQSTFAQENSRDDLPPVNRTGPKRRQQRD